ncbi:MAG TPA: hypothetical protein VGG46_03540 [Terriglobales bacterium]
MKNWKIDRIISVATLVVAFAALILVLRKPAAVAPTQTSSSAFSNSQPSSGQLPQAGRSSQPNAGTSTDLQNSQAVQQAGAPQPSGFSTTQRASQKVQSQQAQQNQPQQNQSQQQGTQISPEELSAAIAQAAGAIPGSAGGQLSPNSDLGSMPAIKDQQVSFDGDVVHGKFLTTIAGKDVWITISGHIGDKDGYATFDPTEFKVGDVDVPVSLVNGPLQRELAAQRDKMKLPN